MARVTKANCVCAIKVPSQTGSHEGSGRQTANYALNTLLHSQPACRTSVMQMSTRYCSDAGRRGKRWRSSSTEEKRQQAWQGPRLASAERWLPAADQWPGILPTTTCWTCRLLSPAAATSHATRDCPSTCLHPEDVGGGHVRLPAVLGRLLHAPVRLRLRKRRCSISGWCIQHAERHPTAAHHALQC